MRSRKIVFWMTGLIGSLFTYNSNAAVLIDPVFQGVNVQDLLDEKASDYAVCGSSLFSATLRVALAQSQFPEIRNGVNQAAYPRLIIKKMWHKGGDHRLDETVCHATVEMQVAPNAPRSTCHIYDYKNPKAGNYAASCK